MKQIVTNSRKVTTEVKPCNTHVHQVVGISLKKKKRILMKATEKIHMEYKVRTIS